MEQWINEAYKFILNYYFDEIKNEKKLNFVLSFELSEKIYKFTASKYILINGKLEKK
jgi:hypothetical protein